MPRDPTTDSGDLVSLSGMVETHRLQGEVPIAIGCETLSNPSALEGGRFGMGVIKVSWSTPTLTLPHHRRGREFCDRVKSTLV